MQSFTSSLLMLLLVLAAIPVVLWAVKRMQTVRMPGQPRELELIAQLPLGPRERVVTVRVHGRVLVLGATGQGITLLAELDSASLPAASASPPAGMQAGDGSFAALLSRMRGAGRLP